MSQSASHNARLLPNELDARALGVLTNASAAILGPVPAGQTYRVYSVLLTETTGVAKTYTLRVVPTGGADTAVNNVATAIALAGNEMQQLESAGVKPLLVLTGGDSLKGLASAGSAVNYFINYSTEK